MSEATSGTSHRFEQKRRSFGTIIGAQCRPAKVCLRTRICQQDPGPTHAHLRCQPFKQLVEVKTGTTHSTSIRIFCQASLERSAPGESFCQTSACLNNMAPAVQPPSRSSTRSPLKAKFPLHRKRRPTTQKRGGLAGGPWMRQSDASQMPLVSDSVTLRQLVSVEPFFFMPYYGSYPDFHAAHPVHKNVWIRIKSHAPL